MNEKKAFRQCVCVYLCSAIFPNPSLGEMLYIRVSSKPLPDKKCHLLSVELTCAYRNDLHHMKESNHLHRIASTSNFQASVFFRQFTNMKQLQKLNEVSERNSSVVPISQMTQPEKCHLEVTPVSKLRSGYISVVCKCNRMPNIINLHLWSPPINICEWGRLQLVQDLNCVSGFRVVCKHEEGCASGRHDVTRQWNDRGRRLSSDRRATATSSPCSPHCLSMSMAGETQDIPTGQSYLIKVIQTNWLRALCFPRWLKYDAHCLKLRWADAQLMTPQSSSLNQTHLYFCCFQENLCGGRKESFHLQQDFFLDQTLLCSSIWTHRTHCPCGQCLTNTFKYH